ncbi:MULTISPECIES: hypothetical protein [Streptomyces]|uniref:hypothetical protein n=1 Tax=Streptomyces TaxID=1883 RepID=UPI0012980CE9|nr:hypothetical protein [Streptomyces kaniharaensis]
MEKPLVIVRDECWELMEASKNRTTPEADAAHHGIGKEEILKGLLRQTRKGMPSRPVTG